jgi:hypothetical protein
VIAGGIVMKAGPATAEPSAIIIPINPANLFTPKDNPAVTLCKPEVLEGVRKMGEDDGGEAEKEKEADHIGDGCQHDRGGEGGVDPQRL